MAAKSYPTSGQATYAALCARHGHSEHTRGVQQLVYQTVRDIVSQASLSRYARGLSRPDVQVLDRLQSRCRFTVSSDDGRRWRFDLTD